MAKQLPRILPFVILAMTVAVSLNAAPSTDGSSMIWPVTGKSMQAELHVVGPNGFEWTETSQAGQIAISVHDVEGSPLVDGSYRYTLVTSSVDAVGSQSAQMRDLDMGTFQVVHGTLMFPAEGGDEALQPLSSPAAMAVNGSATISGSDGGTMLLVEETSPTPSIRRLADFSNNGGGGITLTDTAVGGTAWGLLTSSNGDFVMTALSSGATELQLSPGGDLTIDGSLTTAGGTYPDYVFEDDYELMPLSDLEGFIENEGHLPNIPSAAEVEKTGQVNMTEMQRLLLEKIEELTLYTLQQQKRIEALEALQATSDEP